MAQTRFRFTPKRKPYKRFLRPVVLTHKPDNHNLVSMSVRGFDSGSDSDQEYDFVIDNYDAAAIEAKRDRDDLEGSDDEAGESERDTQRQRRLPSQEVQDLVQELDNLQEELRVYYMGLENDMARLIEQRDWVTFKGVESGIFGIVYVMNLFRGQDVDEDRSFDGVSLDLLPKLNRMQELFRTFVPSEIALYGRIVRSNRRKARGNRRKARDNRRKAAEYVKMVSNVMDYYTQGIEQERLPYTEDNPFSNQTEERVARQIRKNAHDTLRLISTITPQPRPYADYGSVYVDEYIRGLKQVVAATSKGEGAGNIRESAESYWNGEHDKSFELKDYGNPKRLQSETYDDWFVLVNKFDQMLQGGPVLSSGEMHRLQQYFRGGRDQGDVASRSFEDVYKQVEEELGTTEFELQRAVSALPEIGIDKDALRTAYQSPDADQSVFGELVRLEELTEPLVFHQFVRAHNKARAIRDWIPRAQARYDYDPFARESGLDTVLFNLQALEAQVKSSLDRGQNVFAINPSLRILFDKYRDKVDDLVAKYNYVNNLRVPYLSGVVELFELDEKPSMPQRASDEDNWDGPIEEGIYNLKNFMYGRVQDYKDVLQALDEALLGFQSAYPESSFTRYLHTYSLMLVKMLLFDGIKTEFAKFDFTSPRLNETFEAKSLNEIFETVEGRNWRDAFDAAIQTFVYVETGDSSFIKSKVARLQELAHNKALRKDAAKIAKCCGCCDGETARPSYMTDESFKKGPDHDNAEYAVVRQEVMDHLDARFDEDLAQMVELAMELKKLQIADEHADTLARIAVSQFAKRL